MPDMWLTNNSARIQHAVELLRSALVAPKGKHRKVVIVETDSSGDPGGSLKAGHSVIDQVLSENGHIVIVPRQHLEIYITTDPIDNGDKTPYQTYIDHVGDFVNIVMPYRYPMERGQIQYRKWCFVIRPDEDEMV